MSVQDIQNPDQKDNNHGTTTTQEISQLSHAVKHSIRRYLYELDGAHPNDMYELVLRQVEQPLFEAILEHTKGNQSRAAELLGLNRGTLRKKLRSYNLHK
ncbi:MAG TPA: DNA-binding transcriptional regulator Fis [Gammaproteobacteria bacterium]|nr:DNA-binding transcriptional regulator Fis [Gammaproteobacteria bacterium]